MSKSKKTSPEVQLMAYNQSARDYLDTKSDKSAEDLTKTLAAITQLTSPEVWDLDNLTVCNIVINSAEIVYQSDYKQNMVWNIVKLFSQISQHVAVEQLVVKFQLLPVLVRLLHSIPPTTHNRTVKLLELLQVLVQDFEVVSEDAYLAVLAQDLFVFLAGDDHREQVLAATILSSLLRNNVLMVKLVLTHCEVQEKLTHLRSLQDPGISLILETIEMRLNQPNLHSAVTSPAVLAKILARTVANVDIAYKNEEAIMIRFYDSYLQDLARDERVLDGLREVDSTESLAKLLAIANFSKGGPRLWQTYFNFCLTFTQITAGDKIITFNNIFKLVLHRLEVKPYKDCWSALDLLTSCLRALATEELTQADRRNLKFQVDQILPGLGNMLSTHGANQNEILTSLKCFQLLNLIQSVEPVGQTSLASILLPDKIYQAFITDFHACKTDGMRSRQGLNFITLSQSFSQTSESWQSVKSKAESDPEVMTAIAKGIKENLFYSQEENSEAMKLMIAKPEFLDSRKHSAKSENENAGSDKPECDIQREVSFLVAEDKMKLDQCLEDLTAATSGLNLDEEDKILPQVLNLHKFVSQGERAQIRCLRDSLQAADQRILHNTWHIQHLNQEKQALTHAMDLISGRYRAAREELNVIKSQHKNTSSLTKSQIQTLKQTLSNTEAELEDERAQREAACEANEKMKKEFAAMRSEMEALIKDRETQEEHLRETKAALSKRDDKLKRTMKQLDEVQTKVEDMAKKNEKLEKNNKSLESLTRNQEEVIIKKDKMLEDKLKEVEELTRMRDAIFNLSKNTTSAGSC